MDYIPIKKSTQVIDGKETEIFIVPAMEIKQGAHKRKIPHPNGIERLIFLDNKEAVDAIKKAGFLNSLIDYETQYKTPEENPDFNKVINSIMELLKDSNHSVIASAIFSLGEMKATKSTEALIEFLNHTNSSVCQSSVEALSKIGLPALPSLINTLQDESWEKRVSAAKCIGEMAQYRTNNLSVAINPLLYLLSDSNPIVKSTAAVTLSKIYKTLT